MSEKIKSAIWAIGIIVLIVIAFTIYANFSKQDQKFVTFNKKTVTMITDDGKELSADLYEPVSDEKKKYPGLVLLSPFGESREIYTDIAKDLCSRQYVILSVDVRNSGESQIEDESFVDSISKLSLDANTAVYYMLEQSNVMPDKIAILGTALTARSSLMVKGFNNVIKGAVLVSAVLDSAGYHVIEESPDCPILVIVSIQDANAGSQALDIFQASANPLSKIETYFNAGVESELWRSPIRHEMQSYIIEWLNKVLSK